MITEAYTEAQVREVLVGIGLKPRGDTYNDFLCLCPFHSNHDSPAMSVSKSHGSYICFSPECGVTGSLKDLVKRIGRRNEFEARRFIAAKGDATQRPLEELVAEILDKRDEWEEFPESVLSRMTEQFWQVPKAQEYMHCRGMNDKTCRDFGVGYSAKRDMITVPVHSPDGLPIGMVGRSIADKSFKNSGNLHKNHTIFNMHRARRNGGTIVLCESAFDTMRIEQAGYPQAAALLGGNLSPYQVELINRNFSKVVIFTDNDPPGKPKERCRRCHPNPCKGHRPGRLLGRKISEALPYREVVWADYGVCPEAKDACDMTDQQIAAAIEGSISNYEYSLLNADLLS